MLINVGGFTKDLTIKTLTDDGKNEKAWHCMIGYRPHEGTEAGERGDGHGGADRAPSTTESVEAGEYDIRVSEVNQPLDGFREEYSFGVHEFILRKIVDGDWHWEDAMVGFTGTAMSAWWWWKVRRNCVDSSHHHQLPAFGLIIIRSH